MSTLPVTPWVTVEQFHNETQWKHCHYLLHGEVRKDTGTAHFSHEQMKARLLQRLNEILKRQEVTTLSAILPSDTAEELKIDIETSDLWSQEG